VQRITAQCRREDFREIAEIFFNGGPFRVAENSVLRRRLSMFLAPTGKCSLCSSDYHAYGHNPEPLRDVTERCCESCNWTKVVPARLIGIASRHRIAGGGQ
jgi:hypothetical protein